MADPFIGQELGGYRITRLLKRTMMSMIYLAWDPKLQRDVVIKIMLPSQSDDESFAARFQQEALATARLSHPNIVHIYDFGAWNDLYYMVMEYLPGGSLYDRLVAAAREGKRLDPTQSAAIVRQIALALDHAHLAGIIHRDVKPSNILFARDGRPVLTDLGIARAHEGPRLTKTMTAIGTPEYMSPEQGRGDPVDGRSDIYSLGVVLYELLAGTLPFQADTAWGLIFQHMQGPPPPIESKNPAVSPAMRSVIEKALAKRPEERFQTGREMADAIQRALEAPTRRLYPTPTSLQAATPQAKRTRPTPPPPKIEEEKTRLITAGGAQVATAVTPPAGSRRRKGAGLWFAGASVALLTLGLLFVFSGVLRPSSPNPAPSPVLLAGGTIATAYFTSVPVTLEPTVTLQPVELKATEMDRTPGPTTALPTYTATALPPSPTLSHATATAMRASSTPTVRPTNTPTSLPSNTPAPRPTPTLSPRPTNTFPSPIRLPAPVLLSPEDEASVSGRTTFAWRWDGPALAENQAFELRIWKDGQPDHYGAAEPTQQTNITIILGGAYGVQQGGPGNYYWTVAVVTRNPYQRVGPEAPPRRLLIGSDGGSGSSPTWTPPPP